MPPIVQIGNHIASSVLTFAALVALAGVIASFLAYRHGGQSRAKRRAIFTLVGAVGMLAAAAVTFARLHARLGLSGFEPTARAGRLRVSTSYLDEFTGAHGERGEELERRGAGQVVA